MATKQPFATGAQVEHTKFGFGSVISCSDEYLVIKFDEHGEKKFITSIILPPPPAVSALKRATGRRQSKNGARPEKRRLLW